MRSARYIIVRDTGQNIGGKIPYIIHRRNRRSTHPSWAGCSCELSLSVLSESLFLIGLSVAQTFPHSNYHKEGDGATDKDGQRIWRWAPDINPSRERQESDSHLFGFVYSQQSMSSHSDFFCWLRHISQTHHQPQWHSEPPTAKLSLCCSMIYLKLKSKKLSFT